MARPSHKLRFKPVHLAFAILVAGWVPCILMALVAYSTLSRTLETEIIGDRRTLVSTLSSLLGYDLMRIGEVMSYYQTLPTSQAMLSDARSPLEVQDWLATIYYGQPRIDGLFVTSPEGRILAALPRDEQMIGQLYPKEALLGLAPQAEGYYVTPMHPRLPDGRRVGAVVAPIRSKGGELLGLIGAQVLVERLGRRLKEFEFGEESVPQVIDQTGTPIFNADLSPKATTTPLNEDLLTLLRQDPDGVFTYQHDLFTAHRAAETPWTAFLRQPVAVAHRPVRHLVTRMAGLAAWLLIGTAVIAFTASRLYQKQHDADERVRREMLFSEKMLATMPLGIGLFDPADRKLLKSNESLLAMAREFARVEKAPGEIVFSDLSFAAPEMFEKTVNHVSPFQAREVRATDRNGEMHFLALNVFPVQDTQDRTQGILFLAEDTTGDALVRKELLEANTAKDEFLALLSHELRNPLSPVITMVSELDERCAQDPEARQALDVIRRNVELEARLIDDLLDVTRISRNKLQLAVETVDAHQIVQRALEICAADVLQKRLTVDLSLEATRHYVEADPARLQQVLWNLIKNAVKFTPEGGRIRIGSRDAGPRIAIEVADNGVGIDPQRLDRIFDAFEQGGASVTRQFGGLGLGLAISQAMVHAHGGTITAASEGGNRGAQFTVAFATVDPPGEISPAPRPVSEAAASSASRRILVVDDHPDTCLGMERLLKRHGYEVRTAATVAAALDAAAREPFDILISDLGLPDGTGFDLLAALRRDRPIQAIALSGFGMESDLKKSREAGFVEHLIKPVNIDRLVEVLRSIPTDPSAA